MDDRPPEAIQNLRRENDIQNQRIEAIADDMAVVKAGLEQNYREMNKLNTYLVGIDGDNGLRGELRKYQRDTDARLEKVITSLEATENRLSKIGSEVLGSFIKVVSAMGGVAGVTYTLVRIWNGLNG